MATPDELINQFFSTVVTKYTAVFQAYLRGDMTAGAQIHDPAWWKGLTQQATTILGQLQPSPPPPPPPLVSDYKIYPVPTLARPARYTLIGDPTFRGLFARITDPSMVPGAVGLRHEYSRFPALNADNSLMVVQVLGGAQGGAYQIRRVADGAFVTQLMLNGDPEASWHPTDSSRLLYRTGHDIHVVHTDTHREDVLFQATAYDSIGTNEEGRPSDDWRYYACLGKRGGQLDLLVIDLLQRNILTTLRGVQAPDWVGMSPSGKYVVMMGPDGTVCYDRSLNFVRQLFPGGSHSDFCLDTDGTDALVYQAMDDAQLAELGAPNPPNGAPFVKVRLSDGKKQIVLGDTNDANWRPQIVGCLVPWSFTSHISGIISRSHPGWALVSTYCSPGDPQVVLSREVFLLKLDGSGQIRRLVQHRSDQAILPDGSKDYFAEPHATSSFDGTKVVFASTWNQPGRYDDYLLTLVW